MDALINLWLPILLSAVAVFFASSIVWMALPIHKKDYKGVGGRESELVACIKSLGISPGMYMFPFADCKNREDPAAKQRFKEGPSGTITVMAPGFNFGKTLGLWMFNLVLVSIFIGYIASVALKPGTEYLRVFQLVGATAFLAHGGSALCDSIWKGRPWSLLPGALFDAIVYALITAGVFGWLWPKAI